MRKVVRVASECLPTFTACGLPCRSCLATKSCDAELSEAINMTRYADSSSTFVGRLVQGELLQCTAGSQAGHCPVLAFHDAAKTACLLMT